MRAHDEDLQDPGFRRPADLSSAEQTGRGAAIAQRALVDGRSDTLDRASLLHLQRAAGNSSVSRLVGDERDEPSPVLDVVGRGGGQPLDAGTQAEMEDGLGHDLSDVRVHTDATAADSAKSVGAHAYTVGSDVVFQHGQYNPASDSGRRTLAHELTHVVQQRSGPVDGTDAGGGIMVSDPSDRFEQEAERTADAVASRGAAPVADAGASSSAPSMQREAAPGEEEKKEEEDPALQGLFVQREGAVPEEAQEEETTS